MDVLLTSRLKIRPLTIDDTEALHWLLDHDLQWAGPDFSQAQRAERVRFAVALAGWRDTGSIYGDRAILLREQDEIIGIVGFRPWLVTPEQRALFDPSRITDRQFSRLELGIGYALSSQHRHKGYATEAVQALINYAFQELRIARVVALTERGNESSVAVMQRSGMAIGYNPDPEVTYPWCVGLIENEA